MDRKFRFDQRVDIPNAPADQEVVKCFGLPLMVSAAKPDEVRLQSGLTRTQQMEVAQFIKNVGIGSLAEQKQRVANGRLR